MFLSLSFFLSEIVTNWSGSQQTSRTSKTTELQTISMYFPQVLFRRFCENRDIQFSTQYCYNILLPSFRMHIDMIQFLTLLALPFSHSYVVNSFISHISIESSNFYKKIIFYFTNIVIPLWRNVFYKIHSHYYVI